MIAWQVFTIFATLSLLAVGGMSALLPEIHRQIVELHGWLDDADFVQMFALAQAAPGPNVLVASLLGWRVAGAAGLAAATAGILLPSGALAWVVGGALIHRGDSRWLKAIRLGLVPVAVGLMFASGLVLGRAAGHSWALVAITVGATVFVWRAPWSPLWVLAAGGMLGLVLVLL
ncbi:chromate transporter [Roseomonas sp. OT10]|uniref:chromate transporter n=1 Tax=Roseomonas cutis TaxID=2897332 RepID=UPI001E497028|nr:chromate transporter [Roseomonas sp. OT10]UFN47328.1 chromate transporter [Roseomonas sp. OT10]